jgi:hypothetical protein
MNKKVLLFTLIMVMTLVLCACGEKKENTESSGEIIEEVSGEQNEGEYTLRPATQEEIDMLEIVLNNGSFKIKEKYEDVKGRMENEIKPAQSYTPCGGSDDEQVTCHYFDGMNVEETHEGYIYNVVISGYDFPESKATIAGVKLGDTPENVKEKISATPDSDSEYTINYTFGDVFVSFGLDFEGDGNVNYMSIFDASSGMV